MLNPANTVFLSVLSLWEITIKIPLGKLTMDLPLATVADQQAKGIQLLPITLQHVLTVESLATPHRDPFDRLLVAQAMVEKSLLLSSDDVFADYPVKLLW